MGVRRREVTAPEAAPQRMRARIGSGGVGFVVVPCAVVEEGSTVGA